jgi:hypothetical protein
MRQFYKMHGKYIDKKETKRKNLNTSNTQSLVQYCQKQYLPQWSRHSVARDPRGVCLAIFVMFALFVESHHLVFN